MFGHYMDILGHGVAVTLVITGLSFAVGTVLGLPVAVMRRSRLLVLRAIATAFVEIVRAVPPIVWLFVIFYGFGEKIYQFSTLQAAVGGLGLIATAYLSEIFRAGLNAVPRGQWQATKALGLPTIALYRRVILPQAAVLVIPPAATYAIGLLKDSAIASVIGAHDVTFQAVQQSQTDTHTLYIFGLAGLLYVALSVPIAAVSRLTDRLVTSRVVAR